MKFNFKYSLSYFQKVVNFMQFSPFFTIALLRENTVTSDALKYCNFVKKKIQ